GPSHPPDRSARGRARRSGGAHGRWVRGLGRRRRAPRGGAAGSRREHHARARRSRPLPERAHPRARRPRDRVPRADEGAAMIALLRSELLRFRSRRLVKALSIVALLGMATIVVILAVKSNPPPGHAFTIH